ncbi:hypothetical protein ZEAMMB73_Zm00001d015930 [Zea mays]|uniref:Uncharacterized protein n=1 Tax=Zea mays TaxID=4577 RepID=A0A1D6H4L7_MAIZE|nr:hypothetical protein ZEAMMB73_Zm00001d015930 [Zea mays]AQK69767.1 hypothetical protein ZEAMMB73_Zm00001d015930 [Zea mays]
MQGRRRSPSRDSTTTKQEDYVPDTLHTEQMTEQAGLNCSGHSDILGLGVVCNKKGGFGVDDFVVEFLGRFTLLGDGMKSKMVLNIYKTTVKIKLLSFTTLC